MSSDLQARLQAALGDAYRLERELARGGMSRLFLATEASLNRQVVVKVLPPDFTSQVSTERFRQEIELAAHLQHPNILPVLAAGTRENLLYYVIPYVPGESLRHRLTREGRLPVPDAIRVLHEIADALAYAHAEGVIHRDIKPENILLEGSHAVLTDFGVARALGESRSEGRLTDTGLALGTPGYMAPEQAMGGREIDGRADVYALAVVGYEMLAGQPPFTGPSAQAVVAAHLTATPRPLLDLRPEAPPEAANAIARAMAKDPNARLQTAAELRDAIGPAPGKTPVRRRSRRLLQGAGVALILLGGAATLLFRRGSPSTLDPTLLAVAPFDVLASGLGLWREGLVDLLSRNLDGAGPLRTVAPSVVIRRWSGRADPPSAIALGRSTGAGLAVFGQLVPTGRDSVRLTATLVDVSSGRTLQEVELKDASGSMDRLSDSLTLTLLRGIGESRAIGSVRATALRATSLPALKAFLQGEQYFRRLAWDSAMASYRRALDADSNFALAYRRMGTVLGWTVIGGDSLSGVYLLRAAALNHGLAPRDSLLIAADSLMTALFTNSDDTLWRSHRARLFSTLNEAVQRYPGDPEAWYLLGDARVHFRQAGRSTLQQELEAFDRAIELDSAYSESYIHPVEIALHLRNPERARQYISGYLKHSGGAVGLHAQTFRLVDRLLDNASGARAGDVDSALKLYSAGVLFSTVLAVSHWPDSLETAVHVARALVKSPPSGVPLFDNRDFRNWWLTSALAYRGHLKAAYEAGPRLTERIGTMAALGGVPHDSAAALFQRWLREPRISAGPDALPFGFNLSLFDALPWWAANGDTASLAAMVKQMRSLPGQKPEDIRPWLQYAATSAEEYLALAKGDSAGALTGFISLPDTICPCGYDQIVKSQLLAHRGRDREALAVFEGQYPDFMSPASGLWHLQRGRAFEKVGRRDEAIDDYRFTAAVWQHADPELQPYVTEARQALARLTSEPRP